jgi:nitrous oxide reductase accessory protein NosL
VSQVKKLERQTRRRTVLVFGVFYGAALLIGCRARNARRCAECGMSLDENSAFLAELRQSSTEVKSATAFDSAKCGFRYQGKHPSSAGLYVQEYYERTWLAASAVRYVIGSDVLSPMGHDLIPVLPLHVDRFMADHKGKKVVTLEMVGPQLLRTVDTQ